MENIEEYIHAEVLKLYSDAGLPGIEIDRPNDKQMIMVYHSERKLSDLATGLLNGCFSYFNES